MELAAVALILAVGISGSEAIEQEILAGYRSGLSQSNLLSFFLPSKSLAAMVDSASEGDLLGAVPYLSLTIIAMATGFLVGLGVYRSLPRSVHKDTVGESIRVSKASVWDNRLVLKEAARWEYQSMANFYRSLMRDPDALRYVVFVLIMMLALPFVMNSDVVMDLPNSSDVILCSVTDAIFIAGLLLGSLALPLEKRGLIVVFISPMRLIRFVVAKYLGIVALVSVIASVLILSEGLFLGVRGPSMLVVGILQLVCGLTGAAIGFLGSCALVRVGASSLTEAYSHWARLLQAFLAVCFIYASSRWIGDIISASFHLSWSSAGAAATLLVTGAVVLNYSFLATCEKILSIRELDA